MENQKKCVICNQDFVKPKYCSLHEWETRKTCSKSCGYKYRSSVTQIWNKGLTKDTDERLLKLSKSLQGKTAWSKGLKGEAHPLYGKKYSMARREKIREWTSGEKHWNWQGGKTEKIHALRKKIEYQEWKIQVYEKDGYKCQHCGISKNLHAHHIKSFRENELLRYDVNNGMTLCNSCHIKLHHKLKSYL